MRAWSDRALSLLGLVLYVSSLLALVLGVLEFVMLLVPGVDGSIAPRVMGGVFLALGVAFAAAGRWVRVRTSSL